MRIESNKNIIKLFGCDDYLLSKKVMFDGTCSDIDLEIRNFTGSCGFNEKTIPDIAKFMGYSKFQIKCFSVLSKIFKLKDTKDWEECVFIKKN